MEENAPPVMFVELNAQRYPLELGQLYLFGKRLTTSDKSNKIVFNIEEKDVDEKHCCVEVSVGEDVYVFDLFSSCGTFVNGERLKPLEKTCIKHGDVMKLGTLQAVRFYHEQLEESHDSSGFGEHNKNNSDIIASSPETTTQSGRHKRFNNHSSDNFLVPTVPPPKSANKSATSRISSFLGTETENALSTSRNSLGLNVSQNKSRNSDSFTIPETQYVGGRLSTASNLSIAESIPDENKNKSDVNFNVYGNGDNDDDDDFCIPETQDVMFNKEVPKSNNILKGLKTLEEKSVDLNDSDDDELLDGSQIRICTQDYNEGFGEENDESMLHSQVIPLIKHTTILLNGSCVKQASMAVTTPNKSLPEEEDKELAKINWSVDKTNDEENRNITNSSTPDLFEFEALDGRRVESATVAEDEKLFEEDAATMEVDEEDFMATQIFPASNNSKSKDKDKIHTEKDAVKGKKEDKFLTLSDKENMHPDCLEPITDLPPTQLFATHEAPSDLASTSSQKSGLKQTESKQNETPILITANKDSNKLPENVMGDDEDDILTQAFVPPPPKTAMTASKPVTHNCFNSTLLDDRVVDKNPASFFAEMDTTPNKVQSTALNSSKVFKMPEYGFTAAKKTSSIASTTSNNTICTDSDMDLLMCTPQLIKEHMQLSKSDELKRNILAAKNKKLFGDDTDDSEDFEEDRTSKDCLVQLINLPKDSKDFDKLLPHLKRDRDSLKRKAVLSEKHKAAKEANKEFKFNILIGQDQAKGKGKQVSSSEVSTRSRDERHAARDKEKEKDVGEKHKKLDRSRNDEKPQQNTRKSKHDTSDEQADKTESKSKKARTSREAEDKDHKTKHKQLEGSDSDEKQKNISRDTYTGEVEKLIRPENKATNSEKTEKRTKTDVKAKNTGEPKKEAKTEDKGNNSEKLEKRTKPEDNANNPEKTKKEASKADKANNHEKAKKANKEDKAEEAEKRTNKEIKAKNTREAEMPTKPEANNPEKAEKKNKMKELKVKVKAISTSKQEERKVEDNPPRSKHERLSRRKNDQEELVQQEKDATKKSERTANNNGKKEEKLKKQKVKQKDITSSEQEEIPIRRLTRKRSAHTSEDGIAETTGKVTSGRTLRLRAAKSMSKDCVVISDDEDLIPTQPLIRTTRSRTSSRSSQKDINDSTVSSNDSHNAATVRRSLNRNNSHVNTSHSAFVEESNTAKTTPVTATLSAGKERKRKADISVPQQNTVDGKRLKRTISQESTNSETASSTTPLRRLISITMVEPERFNELKGNTKGLWAVAKDPADSEVLVMDKSFRTFKFLLAMARGIPIVTSDWLKELNACRSSKKVPTLSKYKFSDPDFEKKHKFSLEKSLQRARDNKKGILYGHEFVMTANIKPNKDEMTAIIKLSGGIVHEKGLLPPGKDNQKIYLISSSDDRKDWHKYRRLNPNIIIVNTEAVMSAIMQQSCTPLSSHVLS